MTKRPRMDYLPKEQPARDMHRRLFRGTALNHRDGSSLPAAWAPANTPHIDELDIEADRSQVFQQRVQQLLKSVIERGEQGRSFSQLEEEIEQIFNETYNYSLFSEGVSPSRRRRLRRKIMEALSQLKQRDFSDELNMWATSFEIVTLFYAEFDDQARRLASNQLPLGATTVAPNRAIHGWVALRSLFRSALFGVSAWTSYLGIKDILAVQVKGTQWANYPGLRGLTALIGAIAISEVMRAAKFRLEACGFQENQATFRGALFSTFRAYPLLSTFTLAFMVADVGSNVYGVVDWRLGAKDLARQTNALGEAVDTHQQEVNAVWEVQREGPVLRQAAINAHIALIDEAIGTHSGESGRGPRWYGVLGAYFGDQRVQLFEGSPARELYANLSDLPANDLETYRGWRIGTRDDGKTWAVAGTIQYENPEVPDKDAAWIIGAGVSGDTALDELIDERDNKGNQYITALGVVQGFRSDYNYSDGYTGAIEDLWGTHWADVQTMTDGHFTQVSADVADWNPEDDALALLNTVDSMVKPLTDDIPRTRDELNDIALDGMNEIGEDFANFNEALLKKLDSDDAQIGNITTPELPKPQFPEFNFEQAVDTVVEGPLELMDKVRRNWGESLSADLSIGLLILVVILLSYADMFLYRRVYRAYEDDLTQANREFEGMRSMANLLLKTLNDYANRGPLSGVYRKEDPEGNGVVLSQEVLSHRMASLLTFRAEAAASPLVEGGGVVGTLKSLGRWIRSPIRALPTDVSLFLKACLGTSSSASRAHDRLVIALEELFSTPDLLQRHFLTAQYRGIGRVHPGELAHQIVEKRRPNNGKELATRIQEEIGGTLERRTSEIREEQNQSATLRELHEAMPDSEWQGEDPERWVTLGEWLRQVDALQDSDALTKKDEAALRELRKQAREIRRSVEIHWSTFHRACQIADREVQDTREDDQALFEVETFEERFKEIEGILAVRMTPAPRTNRQERLNEVLASFDDRIAELSSSKTTLEGVNVESDRFLEWKERLIARLDSQIEALKRQRNDYERSTIRPILNRRQAKLMEWIRKNPPEDERELSAEKAFKRLQTFMVCMQDVMGESHEIGIEGNHIDFNKIREAYQKFTTKMNSDFRYFGLDRGAWRGMDPAHKVGRALHAAFEAYGENLELSEPLINR